MIIYKVETPAKVGATKTPMNDSLSDESSYGNDYDDTCYKTKRHYEEGKLKINLFVKLSL